MNLPSRSVLLSDPLTGALTRHQFDTLLDERVGYAATYRATLTLLVIDIDHFKSVNDSFGHARGDAILVEVVDRLRQTLRSDDLLFRFGGDEFVVLLPAPTRAHALHVAERLLAAVHQAPFGGAPPLSLTLSIGAATFPDDADSPEALFAAADQRVYEAKRAGRGRVSAVSSPARRAPVSSPARLVERDAALAAARELLNTTGGALNTLCVQAAPGSGRTRFLAEISRTAAALGYATLDIAGSPALRARRYGAIINSAADWPTPPPDAGHGPFAAALAQAVRSRGAGRLLITIDDPSEIDAPSLDFLREIAGAQPLAHIMIAYVDGPAWANRFARDATPQFTTELAPLSTQGIRVWLRQALQWEPPDALVEWVAAYSDGFPGRIRRAVDELISAGALVAGDNWRWEASLALGIAPYARHTPAIVQMLDSAPPLVGRDLEIAALRDLLLSNRVVTLVGPGGVGKTRLALQAAAESAADFRDGVFFVPLAGVEQPAHLPAAIMTTLQLPPIASTDQQARLANFLSGRETLLALDNFEHLIDGAALLAELLRAAPQLRLLVTTRERLLLPDERSFVVDGLTLPSSGGSEGAAVQLFRQRARQVDASFAPGEDDERAIARICRLLNGLPLGIELAASFCQIYSVGAILAELERSLNFLTNTRTAQPDRHRSLTAVLDSFWEILSVHERRALQSLAVFRSGFTRDAARAIAGASPFFLDGLTARSVLRRNASGRFTIHELLRQYAAEKLHARPAAAARAYDRHSDYFLRRLVRQYAGKNRTVAAEDEMHGEIDNLRAAWQRAVADCRLERVSAALPAFFSLLLDMGLLREGLATSESARAQLADACAARPDVLAHLEAMRGLMLYHMGRNAEAHQAALHAEALLGSMDAPPVRARIHYTIGTSQMLLGEQAQARARLEKALAAVDGDERLAVDILNTITHLANLESDDARASRYGAEALHRARRAGDRRSEHRVLLFLGIGHMFREQHAAARSYLEPIIAQPGMAGTAMTDILAYANLAQTSWEVQEYHRAATEVERAIALAREVDMRYLEGIGLRVRGLIALATGRHAQAEAAFADALAIFRAARAERDAARVQTEQSLLQSWREEYDAACVTAEEALRIARGQQFWPVVGHALIHRGHALLGMGDLEAAAAAYRDAQQQFVALGRPNRAMEALAGLVEVELARTNEAVAVPLARELMAHLAAGEQAAGGMYDPARVCLAARDALQFAEPGAAHLMEELATRFLALISAQLPPDDLRECIARVPSLRRLESRPAFARR